MRLVTLVGLALCIAACRSHKAPPKGSPVPATPATARGPAAAPPRAGEVLRFRFVDHTEEATVTGALAAAWQRIANHPQRSLLPWGHLEGEAAYRAVQIALTDADVDHYGTGGDETGARPVGQVDAVWNSTRAVYLSRQALYVPGSTSQTYRVRMPAGARLETSLGLLGSAGRGRRATTRARFRITVDEKTVLDATLGGDEVWHHRLIDLGAFAGREATIRFSLDPSDEEKIPAGAQATGDEAGADGGTKAGAATAAANPANSGAAATTTTAAATAAATTATTTATTTVPIRVLHGFFADPLLWAPGPLPGPNVVFILVDTLRADALSVMPHVKAFSATGARFDQAITAAAWTRPSMLAMYGGDLSSAVGQSAEDMIPREGERRRFYRLAPPLVPRLLGARGYRVTAIGNNFFLLGYPQIGLDFGFEEVDDVRDPVKDTPAITRSAIRFLEENKSRPFFLHVHYDAPHWPYTPPAAYRNPARIRDYDGDRALEKDPLFLRYLGEAAYADDAVGEVLGALDRLGLRERTLVVVVGDHGEIFDPAHDHLVRSLGFHTLHHHGWAAYDELIHVPLLVSLPGAVPAAVVTTQVRLFDLGATILDYLNVPGSLLPERGRSLRPLIEGREHTDRIAFCEGQNVRAVRADGYAYLRRSDGKLSIAGRKVEVTEELYDLARDPSEHDNRAARDPEALARMRALFDREAPVAPTPPKAVYHLVVAPGPASHRIAGTIVVASPEGSKGTPSRIGVRAVAGGEIAPLDERSLGVVFGGPGSVDFSVEPPEARLLVTLTRDGVPLERRLLLAGAFGIPILDGPLEGERLRRLDARHPPELGHRGDVLLYRDPAAAGAAGPPADVVESQDSDEVSGMMQRWGYAQPGGGRTGQAGKKAN